MICSKCSQERGENFRAGRKQCKSCDKEVRQTYYQDNLEMMRQRSRDNRKKDPEKVNAGNRRYRRENPEKAREWGTRSRRKANGWEPGRWERVLAEQRGLCAVPECGRPAEVADHCHATGRARGALCSGCNKALGLIADSPERAVGLAEYLRATVYGGKA